MAKYSGNQSSQNLQTPFGFQEKMIFNNEDRPGLSNEPSIQNHAQLGEPGGAVNFKINPHLKKVMISKDQIKLHNPNAEHSLANINQSRAQIQKHNVVSQVRQPSYENSQAQILDNEPVPSSSK